MAAKHGAWYQNSRASFWFGIATAGLAIGVVLGTLLLALTDHPYRAVWMLAAGLLGLGLARAAWPGDPWFGSRNRWWDVAAYVLVGIAILVLSPALSLVP